MQIVIDIPEDLYEECTRLGDSSDILFEAIRKGKILPKEHGSLIDVDEVVKEICIDHKANSIYELSDELRLFIKKYLNEAPTIFKPTIEYMIKNYAVSESEG